MSTKTRNGSSSDTRGKKVKRVYKDSLFRKMFTRKENSLWLFKEFHPESDATEEDVEIVDSATVLVEGMLNDVSFRVGDSYIVLLEAQSTWSDNFAARCFFYTAEIQKKYVSRKGGKKRLLSSAGLRLPRPELYVVYTGHDKKEAPSVVKLSDMYNGLPSEGGSVECTVKVLKGDDTPWPVGGYIGFCSDVRSFMGMGEDLEAAAQHAADKCIEGGFMVDFFQEVKEELSDMLFFTEKDVREANEDRARELAEEMAKDMAEEMAKDMAKDIVEAEVEAEVERVQERNAKAIYAEIPSVEKVAAILGLSQEKVKGYLGK